MAVILALLSAVAYGSSDFIAGAGGRRARVGIIALIVQVAGLATTLLTLVFFAGNGPDVRPLAWGAVSGVGSGLGTATLYRGLAVGRMSVVASLSAVTAALVPAVVGLALGEPLTAVALAGVIIAVPATAMVSWQRGNDRGRSGVAYGLAAGFGFALLFIALDQAGTSAGAWPLVPLQAVAAMIVAPLAIRESAGRTSWRSATRAGLSAGVIGGAANLLFLAASGTGQLALVAVIASLYPTVTVLLARLVLHERWSRAQAVGLGLAAMAIALIAVGA